MGRWLLAQKLALGEGASRTLLKRLVTQGMSAARREGAILTAKGRKLWLSLGSVLTSPFPIGAGRLSLDKFDSAILVRHAQRGVRLGIEQRDAAIKEGATGASTLVFTSGKYVIPGGSQDCETSYPDKLWARLREIFTPAEGDVIIISSAVTQQFSEIGCIASALATVSEMEQARLKALARNPQCQGLNPFALS